MLIYILLILVIINILFVINIFYSLKKEQKRNRILQSFISGIIRSISDYYSSTDSFDSEYIPEKNKKLPIPYEKVLESIEWEFGKDFCVIPFEKWLKNDRLLFDDEKYGNDGFNFMYFDFFDKLNKQWNSSELMHEKDKELLDESVEITKDNLDELTGEIAIFKDIKKGKLNIKDFKNENLDNKLHMLFIHIKPEYRDELKKYIESKL